MKAYVQGETSERGRSGGSRERRSIEIGGALDIIKEPRNQSMGKVGDHKKHGKRWGGLGG